MLNRKLNRLFVSSVIKTAEMIYLVIAVSSGFGEIMARAYLLVNRLSSVRIYGSVFFK